MKYANKLTDNELKELYRYLIEEPNAAIKQLTITKNKYFIKFDGRIIVPKSGEIEENFRIMDYDVDSYDFSDQCTPYYRRWMYKKFGDEYAKEYFFLSCYLENETNAESEDCV